MKLRIFQNSIRLRLSQSEVAQLADDQTIEMHTDLFPQRLTYQLSSNQNDLANVTFKAGLLRMTVPSSQLRSWATSDQVGIDATLEATPGRSSLNLLIEKDFKCLHGEVEDQEDCFVNPLSAAAAK